MAMHTVQALDTGKCMMGWGWQAEPDVKGDRTLEYALAFNLFLGNTLQEI